MTDPLEPSECAEPCTTRRAALALGATGAAALLAGCSAYGGSSDSGSSGEQPDDAAAGDPPAAGASAADDPAAGPTAAGAGGGVALAKTSQIPVGGGKIFAGKGVVVTQPTAGNFKAFSTVCTHQGCAVEKVQDGTIDCLCHGSKFKISDGSVTDGPARKPLAAKKIVVDGDSVKLA